MTLGHLDFTPPGPGAWFTDGLHSLRPATAISGVSRSGVQSGMRISNSRYGSLFDGMLMASLHRFTYGQMRFLIGRPPGADPVAKARFDAEVAANPELQERFARAADAVESKRWRRDTAFWDEVSRPWLMGRTLELTDEVPASMSDQALVAHLDEILQQSIAANQHHHILNMVHGAPRTVFIVCTGDWTGLTAMDLEPLLVGSSPISAGDEPELRALTTAIHSDGAASDLVAGSDDPAARLDALVNRGGSVGEAARLYVRVVGYRIIEGWEPMNPHILEQPQLILDKVAHSLGATYPALDEDVRASVRDKVPDAHRNEFDEILKDARDCHRIRDERDIYCNMPVGGLLRRAVIEAGRRLAKQGRIDDAEFLTEASRNEIERLLLRGEGPLSSELQDRYEYRQTYTIRDIPPVIGEPDQVPVTPDWLPPASRLLARGGGLASMFEAEADKKLTGQCASPGVYEGVARLVRRASELDRVAQGDVLVTESTNPAFNIVLPRLGAIVTAFGGLLSHAAIVAREFGLPAVVGCKDATMLIEDGARVRVDADKGEITIL